MLALDPETFFSAYRREFGPISKEVAAASGLVANLDHQLKTVAADPLTSDPRHFAYMLGTQVVETPRPFRLPSGRRWLVTFGAVEEFGDARYFARYNSRRDLGNGPTDGPVFKGRGHVMVTGRRNYTILTEALRRVYGLDVDLVANPELLLDPDVSYAAMSYGMHTGLFVPGHTLKRYFPPGKPAQPWSARAIINPGELPIPGRRKGKPEAIQRIVDAYSKFEKIIREAQYGYEARATGTVEGVAE
jgi:hypothetical protein